MVKSSVVQLDSVFHALADSTRRDILRDISLKEKTVSDVARPHAMSLAAVSKHLNVLESANLIKREKRGSFQLIYLNPAALKPIEKWLAYYENIWNRRFDALDKLLKIQNVPLKNKSRRKK